MSAVSLSVTYAALRGFFWSPSITFLICVERSGTLSKRDVPAEAKHVPFKQDNEQDIQITRQKSSPQQIELTITAVRSPQGMGL